MSASAAATGHEIVVYSTSFCGYCDRAKALLERKGVGFREIKVDESMADRETMVKLSGGRRTVPQIFVGARHVGGYEELSALERSGELDKLLNNVTM